ncbi:U3 small nucleolar ribonucleoprotein protein MPP10-like isoform X2 [Papaver somniferum]|uniref:U3 small nucleolar ribonucleoprotein protein MPP10-like isoform X2 n=1 Tax=Papaver somniferum TaxID=3469 RepID=UPI000E6FBBF4|nr:U3 small nucleolar ribonucleoprotein protein MPP10-like isoform X2 [Papaver somniferum]
MAIPKNDEEGGPEALKELKSVDPPLFLSPSPIQSQATRLASQYLYSSLHPFCPKSPFQKLLVKGFDAEQIWQQIDTQSNHLVLNLKRELKHFEKNPNAISKGFDGLIRKIEKKSGASDEEDDESGDSDEEDDESGDSDDDMEDAEESGGSLDEDGDDDEEDDNEEDEDEEGGGIEDKFLKMSDMKKYMKDDEAREYGGVKEKKRVRKREVDGDEDVDDDEEDYEDDDELGEFGVDNGEDDDEMGNARYEDFFGAKKGESTKRKSDSHEGVEDSDSEDEDDFDKGFEDEKEGSLSTYEKEQKKQRAKIEEMEKVNMETKSWNMLGEVSAAERGKNTALEVDLDFEHNVRPAPVITEEVTQSIEDLIKKRVLEGHFDDVQKAPSLPSAAPKEYKEIDENKNTEGLHKSYENEYLQQTGLVPESFSDERKKEASLLFQKLCYKLDALSHFHFTPKPIIEDMSIQVNVPALAMEEIAPLVVSDATMLAPEEVFAGKGDIKEEAELTQAERKRRRASKKRKFAGKTKAETAKRMENKKAQDSTNGKEEPSVPV